MEESSESRYKHIQQALNQIESKLSKSNYNHDSKKKNRNYLKKYFNKSHKDTNLVQTRKYKALKLIHDIDESERNLELKPATDVTVCEVGSFPVIIRNSLSNGDCFYSSVFRALKEREGLLERVQRKYSDINVSDESAFIQSWRNIVADNVETYTFADSPLDIYEHLINKSHDSTGNISIILRGFPAWFRSEFGAQFETVGNKEDFFSRLKLSLKTPGNWVGQIEVQIVQKLLESMNIKLKIENNSARECAVKLRDGMDFIYLINYDETHYKYFSFDTKEHNGVSTVIPGDTEEDNSVSTVVPGDTEEHNRVSTVIPGDTEEHNRVSTVIPGDTEEHNSVSTVVPGDTAKLNPCHQLYDPCTKEPISDFSTLEQRIKDIKRQLLLDIDSKVQFPEYVHNRLDLLLFVLNSEEAPNEKLLQYKNNGQLYESYWDIVFSLGLMSGFPITEDFKMYNGKIETLTNIDGEGFMNQPLLYLSSKKINEGSKSGASDITFVYKKHKLDTDNDLCSADQTIQVTDTCRRDRVVGKNVGVERPLFYFCSSKYFNKDNTKGVDKFDIQNIYTAAKSFHTEYDRKIILLVKDKSVVEEKLRKAIRKYISDEASYVFGINDLFSSLKSFYDFVKSKHKSITKITKEILEGILNLKSRPKPILRLRLHQYIATYKICDAIKEFYKTKVNNKFLVGIVPRGGKTFIAGGIIDTLNPKRVVVLLGAKSETLSQFKEDLFEEFQNFQQYECVDVVNVDSITTIDPSKKYIFIMSVELYKQSESSRTLLQELKTGVNRADLFICDEAHLKQTTSRAVKQMERGTLAVPKEETQAKTEEEDVSEETEESELKQLDKLIQTDVPVVYMTGTYIKPLTAFEIPSENVIIWDYQDIQQAKELSTNEEYFRENFGELYDRALATCFSYGQTYDTIQQQYKKFPELYLLSTQFTTDAKSAFLKQTTGGFPTISHLFEVRVDFNPETTPPERWYSGFTNPKGMLRLLNYLAPPTHAVESIDGLAIEPISSVLKSVDLIAQRIGDRLGYFTSEFVSHSQLWFLPHMQGHPLYKRMCALAGAIFQSSWFRKYFHIIGVSSSVKWAIPRSEQNSIQIKATDGSDSCGTFSWACPTGEKSLKQCLIDQEAFARRKGKGLIILAQNMLHLGISLPCVDIVVLLDVGEKVDERIQKMYRALTESTNKKGGYIIDMNYFRTVTAIMNYQITAEKSRKGKKEVYSDDLKNLFNKVLDIFSIDIDKPIYGTREERARGNSEIQKTTIPELEKIFHSTGKKQGDSMMLEDAGTRLNANIKTVLEKNYKGSYDEFLGSLKEEEERLRKIREEGADVVRAEHDETEESKNAKSPYSEHKIFRNNSSEKQKREAYIDVFKTTLKLGAFGTDSIDIVTLENKLSTDEELRQTLYETLIKRGAIQEDKLNPAKQRDYIIDIMIRPGLIKIKGQGKNSSYIKMKESIDDDEKYPAHVEKVLNYIEEHLTPKAAERHKFGEVFTPMKLVNEMLDTLPTEVWNDKTLKWLDPANGMGNFPIGVFLRLFYGFRTKGGKYVGITRDGEGDYNPGLSLIIQNEDLRRKHIVKDMLFMVELNSKNIAISRNLFKKLAPGVEANIIQMHRTNGFLADVDMKFPNGTVNTFDIVMGNPPFNKGAVRVAMVTNKTRKERKNLGIEDDKSESGFWFKFVHKVLTKGVLKMNGYLLFIHPITWFKPDRAGAHDLILSKQLLNIKIYKNDGAAQKLFGGKGKISIAFYLLENKLATAKTHFEYADDIGKMEEVLLSTKSIISLNYNSIYSKVIKKCPLFSETDDLKHKTIKQCDDSGKNKLITILEERGNLKYVKSSVPHPDQTKPKVIVGGTYTPVVLFDKDGEYGLYARGQRHYFIGSGLEKIEKYFKTKLSTLILRYVKYEQDFIKPGYFPDVRSIDLETINDKTLADYFGFTEEERREIALMPDPIHPKADRIIKITCAQLKGEKADGYDSDVSEGGARCHRFTSKIRRT